MAFAKIDPASCKEDRGKVRLWVRYYLEPNDARYEEHHVYVPIIPDGGIPEGLESEALNAWLDSLPHKWQVNPFHNHLAYFNADDSDAKIKWLMKDTLKTFYKAWSKGDKPSRVAPRNRIIPTPNEAKKSKGRVEDIKKRATGFGVAYGND